MVTLITIESQGGVGNQLFQLALALELKNVNSFEVNLDIWRHQINGARRFEIPSEFLGVQTVNSFKQSMAGNSLTRRISRNARFRIDPKIYLEKGHSFDPKILGIGNDHRLIGYFQSWKYSINSIDFLREKMNSLANASKWVQEHHDDLQAEGPWFAVHVRRGDYLLPKNQMSHGILPLTYYEKSLVQMMKLVPNARPVLFSDDIDGAWKSLKHLNLPNFAFRKPNLGSPLEHLLLMSQANGLILANSSFSWWAAWLKESSERPVFATSNWYPGKTGTPPDLIPKSWRLVK